MIWLPGGRLRDVAEYLGNKAEFLCQIVEISWLLGKISSP
jgi:hypothetical protein